jgi:hypothetical protein
LYTGTLAAGDFPLFMTYHKWYVSGEPMKQLPAFFYVLASGREPVREWLKDFSAEDRKIVGEDIKDVEFAWPIGMPLCRPPSRGLWCAAP